MFDPKITLEQINEVVIMLEALEAISVKTATAYAVFKDHPANQLEGLPELLRAQEQNATALVSQALKIWTAVREEKIRGVI